MTANDAKIEFEPGQASGGIYGWLTASVIPRPIAWVSTVSASGIDNIAPHSFTTVVGVDPPTLCFVSIGEKDTLANVRETGEFVLHIGSCTLLDAMNDTGTSFPSEQNEFDLAGVEREPSKFVAAPRVRGAPIAFECRARGEHRVGNCFTVFGEIVYVAVRSSMLAPDGLPDPIAVDPPARLGRDEWSRLGELLHLRRISLRDWLTGTRSAARRH